MIKNFIYLDESKMYSLSSQIFEGIAEYVLNTSSNEKENQKLDESKVFANIFKNVYQTEEKKYLHDYSYTIFEKHLIDKDKVLNINEEDDFIDKIGSKSFIKITGKVVFNDVGHLSNVLKDFNTMGLALARMQIMANPLPENKNKNINQYAKDKGLTLDKKYLDDLKYLLDFGFENQFEVQLKYKDKLFSTNIKREYLREDENLLIKKYARKTEKEFTIFGIVTQYQNLKKDDIEDNSNNNLKIALMKTVSRFADVELSFTGKLENEIMIDPIAIYTEL